MWPEMCVPLTAIKVSAFVCKDIEWTVKIYTDFLKKYSTFMNYLFKW